MRRLVYTLALLPASLHAAQPDAVPPDLQRDMAVVEGYFDAVRQRQSKLPSPLRGEGLGERVGKEAAEKVGKEAAERVGATEPSTRKPVSGAERDPFQVTPELRSRGERRQAAKALAMATPGGGGGGGEPLPPLQIKALALGAGRFAVLAVEEGAGKARDIVVREGELLQFGDGGLVRVRRIGRDGVVLHTGPGEQDVVLLK